MAKKVSASCWSAVEAAAKQKPVTTPEGSTAASKLKPIGTIPLSVGPTDVSLSGQPSMPPTLAVPDGHRRAIQGLVRTLSRLQKSCQMQGESLDELCAGAHQAVEPRARRQGRESRAQLSLGVAIEVPLAGESGPPGEDSQGESLTLGEGCLRAGPSFWWLGVAEVICDDVECGEEGVLRSSMRGRFLSLRDR
jgi:hypothetical protein